MKKQQVRKLMAATIIGIISLSLATPVFAFRGGLRGHSFHSTRNHRSYNHPRTSSSKRRSQYTYHKTSAVSHTAHKQTSTYQAKSKVQNTTYTNHINKQSAKNSKSYSATSTNGTATTNKTYTVTKSSNGISVARSGTETGTNVNDMTPVFTYHPVNDHIQNNWDNTKSQIHNNWNTTKNNIHSSWDNTKDDIHDDFHDHYDDDDWEWNDADTWMLVGATALVGTTMLMANNHNNTQSVTYVPYTTTPSYYTTPASSSSSSSTSKSNSTTAKTTSNSTSQTTMNYYDNSTNTINYNMTASNKADSPQDNSDSAQEISVNLSSDFESEDLMISLGDLAITPLSDDDEDAITPAPEVHLTLNESQMDMFTMV